MYQYCQQTFLYKERLAYIKNHLLLQLRRSTKNSVTSMSAARSLLQIDNLHTLVWCDIVKNLDVNILLEILFIDRYIQGICSGEKEIVPKH